MGVFTKGELNVFLLSALILGIVFGFDDGRASFELNYWLVNFVKVLIGVALAIFLREWVRKLVAKKCGCTTKFEILDVKRYFLYRESTLKKGLPLGVLLALIITVLSVGKFFFTAINSTEIVEHRERRIGKRFARVTDFETGYITLSAALVSVFLALIFKMLSNYINLDVFVTINLWMCLLSFLPLGSLDGTKILFGSRVLYLFGLVFSVLCFILMSLTGIIGTIALSLITAVVITILYVFYKEVP
jgi:hypothetical protein